MLKYTAVFGFRQLRAGGAGNRSAVTYPKANPVKKCESWVAKLDVRGLKLWIRCQGC